MTWVVMNPGNVTTFGFQVATWVMNQGNVATCGFHVAMWVENLGNVVTCKSSRCEVAKYPTQQSLNMGSPCHDVRLATAAWFVDFFSCFILHFLGIVSGVTEMK